MKTIYQKRRPKKQENNRQNEKAIHIKNKEVYLKHQKIGVESGDKII